MQIAIFDYSVTRNNPVGSCHRILLEQLADDHQFTVFAPAFENPRPERIDWVRVPAIKRPLAVLFLSFHVIAMTRLIGARRRFALVQGVESNFLLPSVAYVHFCHRWFLRNRWSMGRPTGLRGFARWIDHAMHAIVEPWVFRRAKWIVVPSVGLAREIEKEYPFAAQKILRISNPLDLQYLSRSVSFDRKSWREVHGYRSDDTLIVFVALGHFERKGLDFLMEALARLNDSSFRLCVVGGTPALVRNYGSRARRLRLAANVTFTGYQSDVRPFLWAADLFAQPSVYETFGLAAFQAVAAGCPVLTTGHNGIEDHLVPGESYLEVQPTSDSVLDGLSRFREMLPSTRAEMSRRAQAGIKDCNVERFASEWRRLYLAIHKDSGG